jgi:hypothetical protein
MTNNELILKMQKELETNYKDYYVLKKSATFLAYYEDESALAYENEICRIKLSEIYTNNEQYDYFISEFYEDIESYIEENYTSKQIVESLINQLQNFLDTEYSDSIHVFKNEKELEKYVKNLCKEKDFVEKYNKENNTNFEDIEDIEEITNSKI